MLGNLIGTDKTATTVALGNALDSITYRQLGARRAARHRRHCRRLRQCHLRQPERDRQQPRSPGGRQLPRRANISGNIARFDIAVNYIDTPPMQMVYSVVIDVAPTPRQQLPSVPSRTCPTFPHLTSCRRAPWGQTGGRSAMASRGNFCTIRRHRPAASRAGSPPTLRTWLGLSPTTWQNSGLYPALPC